MRGLFFRKEYHKESAEDRVLKACSCICSSLSLCEVFVADDDLNEQRDGKAINDSLGAWSTVLDVISSDE